MDSFNGMPLPMAIRTIVGADRVRTIETAYGDTMFDPTEVLCYIKNPFVVLNSAPGVAATIVNNVKRG